MCDSLALTHRVISTNSHVLIILIDFILSKYICLNFNLVIATLRGVLFLGVIDVLFDEPFVFTFRLKVLQSICLSIIYG